MKIEAVIVCIDYSDFLLFTLKDNKVHFDKTVVVTTTKDLKTKYICDTYGVECIQTDQITNDDLTVNKALCINLGLKHLDCDGWVVQIDADIWLPPDTRRILNSFPLEDKCIYGIDRLMCNSFGKWIDFIEAFNREEKFIHKQKIYMDVDHFPLGGRVVNYGRGGLWVIGFFQLWNPEGSGVKEYPIERVGYDRTDVAHMKKWGKGTRLMIPDIIGIHLSSQDHSKAQNWNGRTSRSFIPDVLTKYLSLYNGDNEKEY